MRRVLFVVLLTAGLGLWWGDATAEPPASTRVIVTFRQAPQAGDEVLIRNLGGAVRHRYDLVPAMAVELSPAAVSSLRLAPAVAMVEEDHVVHLVDTELDNSWGVKHIGAGDVHPSNKGSGIKVAVLDTGIYSGHADLNDNYAGGYDFVNGDPFPWDDHDHGTLVAGVVGAEDNDSGIVGVAPEVDIYALKVLDSEGSGWTSDIIAALDWAVANDIDVVNMSFGGSGYSSSYQTAITNAYEAGLVLVAAAGNEATCPPIGDTVLYPARFSEVIAVAATDQWDDRACFSSTGPAVELAAPGVSVMTTHRDGGYAYASGTSLASPHVAGAAALVIASGMTDGNGNGRVNDEVRTRFQETADDLGAAGRDTWYGYGLVNAGEAVLPPSADNDNDGFADAIEAYVGTDPLDSCPDDPDDDAWPPDMDNDRDVDVVDVLLFKPVLQTCVGGSLYDPRFDLNADGCINALDILLYKPLLQTQCT